MVNFDRVGDMLTRVRNANLVKSSKTKIFKTSLTYDIAKILKREGFIESYELDTSLYGKYHFSIQLKYKGLKREPYITHLVRISKPGLRVYVSQKNIPRVLGGVGIAVLSTSRGLLTDREARLYKLGGEVLFFIW